MGQTLTNGIYLPAEGERNCYTGLAANWTALDSLIGGYNVHISNTTIHVTAEDKQAWNGKADASALTAHTGDTTIHVTAEDKNKWDAVSSKANDSDVVHKSGNETVGGNKTWTGANTFQQNITYERTNFYHQVANPSYILKDTELEKGSLATTHASYPGLWLDKNGNILGYVRFVEYSSGRQTAEFRVSNLIKNGALDPTGLEVNCAVNLELQPSGEKSLIPEQNNDINLGTATKKWKSFNGVEPSSLSLPSDRSARIDISSYFTNTGAGQSNSYTVPANGYIYLTLSELTNVHCFSRSSGNVTNYAQTFTKLSNSTGALYILFPVRKNDVFVATWYTTTTVSVDGAFFIPCQGNI